MPALPSINLQNVKFDSGSAPSLFFILKLCYNKNMKKVNLIVLAGGKGIRLNVKARPKVLFEVKGKPMIGRILKTMSKIAEINKIIFVVGFRGQMVIDYIKSEKRKIKSAKAVEFAWQRRQLGTGHATLKAISYVKNSPFPTIVLNGDHPYFGGKTIKNLLNKFYQAMAENRPKIIITETQIDKNSNFGRIIKDRDSNVIKVVEVKNATATEFKIRQGNVGTYLFDTRWLGENLSKIKKDKISGEYYLTDLVGIAVAQGEKVPAAPVARRIDAIGINTFDDLQQAQNT
ncbi:MAG: bifunctional UDP-N-acetylglucosamine pyrophosphorylase / Glucosamine-1-phosphate N-acetyltransferase [Candidatus Berkelbacteria bacterium Licking1014_7]|uniref:Bifunctional UDP-N-acetylglucosamine pyrophosphorylase / Glucosamine-1-phosphate N-acetyltransferase n=1 Tax=Candidatus Berkelbacteria bacterium Licking1014_7 TaxID=2017147 RepID=A0A554LJN6_9BACT|nr:MAG: bifunctional UDP-N-acetylglucosamine pyrophosphorylase / Glucosamine-1-phosphate N-acetyltransferase [Candidatus Berkelbacteria bacterium Licking1014_7]